MKIHVGTESVNYLSRLIRSLGILKRRKGSRALQKEKRTNMFSFYILCLSHFFFLTVSLSAWLWKTVWQLLTKLSIYEPYNPAFVPFGIYPKELKNYVHTKATHRCL